VSTAGVNRLQMCHLHPILVLVKFKNPKQIRDIKDLRCDKISNKAGKELYDHSLKVETEYKDLVTGKFLNIHHPYLCVSKCECELLSYLFILSYILPQFAYLVEPIFHI